MDIYFNPYTNAAQDFESGKNAIVAVADTLCELKRKLSNMEFSGNEDFSENSIVNFTIISEQNQHYTIKSIFYKLFPQEREKVKLLLEIFGKGKKINNVPTDNWIVKNMNIQAPILEFAVKNNSISLTIPTDSNWSIDVIEFENQRDFLHNLWGQNDISKITEFCINSIKNAAERFKNKYKAVFCEGALNSAPEEFLWDGYGYFSQMDKAVNRDFKIDDSLLKNLGKVNFGDGTLYELRCYNSGNRIFFARNNDKLLIGGFYCKNNSISQNDAIENARNRINNTR